MDAQWEPEDVRIDTFAQGVPGVNGSCQMTITHLPSGLSVSGTGPSGIRLRRDLIEQLAALVDTKGEGLMDRMDPKLAAMLGLVKGQCDKIEHVTLSGTWFRVTVEEVGPEREP